MFAALLQFLGLVGVEEFVGLGAHGKEVRVEEDGRVLAQRGDLYVRKKGRAEESQRWALGEVAVVSGLFAWSLEVLSVEDELLPADLGGGSFGVAAEQQNPYALQFERYAEGDFINFELDLSLGLLVGRL